MEKYHQEQLERIDRLMDIIRAKDPYPLIGSLEFYDIVMFVCQCMWHLKDWILNDREFHAKDPQKLKEDIHAEKCLLICSDLANGSKHLVLNRPKTAFALHERSGVHIASREGIHQDFYYIVCSYHEDPYHAMEIREFLALCREAWDKIINKHYMTAYLL